MSNETMLLIYSVNLHFVLVRFLSLGLSKRWLFFHAKGRIQERYRLMGGVCLGLEVVCSSGAVDDIGKPR